MRVMTFNIRYAEADDRENRWDRRKALALAAIQAFKPDLLGIQECSDGRQAAYLRRHLRPWHFHGVRTDDPYWPGEMAPLLFRREAFEEIASGHFWLSTTPSIPGSKSWDAAFARTVTWAELRHIESRRSLHFVNTHVDYQRLARNNSARLLARWIEQRDRQLPVIVTGDFNAGKNSAAYRRLVDDGPLFDAGGPARRARQSEGSFHGFGTVAKPTAIDWILASRHFVAVAGGVDHRREGERFASDHYPVTAVLRWHARQPTS